MFTTKIDRLGELEAEHSFWPEGTGKFRFEVGCDLSVYWLQPRLDIGLSPQRGPAVDKSTPNQTMQLDGDCTMASPDRWPTEPPRRVSRSLGGSVTLT